MERRPAAPRASSGIERGMAGAERGGGTHGSRSLLRRSRVCSGTARASRTPRPPCRRPPPRTRLWRQERHSALSAPQTGLTPHLPPGQHSQGIQHPTPRRIPPAQLRQRGAGPARTELQDSEDERGDPALGSIPIHHSPTVHAFPSCFQPGQHSGPVGNLRDRPGVSSRAGGPG